MNALATDRIRKAPRTATGFPHDFNEVIWGTLAFLIVASCCGSSPASPRSTA